MIFDALKILPLISIILKSCSLWAMRRILTNDQGTRVMTQLLASTVFSNQICKNC